MENKIIKKIYTFLVDARHSSNRNSLDILFFFIQLNYLYFIFSDKLDNSLSRSRSSSMSSLENASTEAITCLAFADSYIRKSGKLKALYVQIMYV